MANAIRSSVTVSLLVMTVSVVSQPWSVFLGLLIVGCGAACARYGWRHQRPAGDVAAAGSDAPVEATQIFQELIAACNDADARR